MNRLRVKIIFPILLILLFKYPLFCLPELSLNKIIQSKDLNEEIDTITSLVLPADNYIIILDEKNNKIFWINRNGQIVKKTGHAGDEDGAFNSPRCLSLDTEGNIYIADTENHRIQVFNKKGDYLFKFGSYGSKNGKLNSPSGICISPDNLIYVADTGNNRIQVFSKEGSFLFKFGSSGEKDGQFDSPVAVNINAREEIYVADQGNHRIQVFNKKGDMINKFGKKGENIGEFNILRNIYFSDYDDQLYTTDIGLNMIQIFKNDGSIFASFGCEGTEQGEFQSPNCITVSEDGEIFIADSDNHRLQVFQFKERIKPVHRTAKEKKIIARTARQTAAVFKFENIGKAAEAMDYGEVISYNLYAEISKFDYFEMLEKPELEEELTQLNLKDKPVNLDQALLAANKLYISVPVIGSIRKTKDVISIDIRIIHTLTGKDITCFNETITGEEKIRETCRLLAEKIVKFFHDNIGKTMNAPVQLKSKSNIRSITITWSPNEEEDLAGYWIYRAEDPEEEYQFIGWNGKENYTDATVQPEKLYYYKIKAVNLFNNESDFSEAVSNQALPVPNLPLVQNIHIVNDVNYIELKWNAVPDKSILGYNIYRSEDNSTFTFLNKSSVPRYADKQVEGYKKYYYKVTAYNSDGESKINDSPMISETMKKYLIMLKEENVREGPNSKTRTIIRLKKNEKVVYLGEEVKTPTGQNNYLKVRTSSRKEGWVWGKSTELIK